MTTRLRVIPAKWVEDSACTVLARVTAINGSGAATGLAGEGKFLQVADISTITCAVYDVSIDNATPDTAIVSPSVTVATAVLDTVVTASTNWDVDTVGYNFSFTLPATAFPTGNRIYRAEFKFTQTGGNVFWVMFQGTAEPLRTS